MKLKKKFQEPMDAWGLYNHYWNHKSNLEAYACTNAAFEDYDNYTHKEHEFSVFMQRQRALGDKNKEYVKRLVEIGKTRGSNVLIAPEQPHHKEMADLEYLFFTANYTFKKWSRYKQVYHFNESVANALRQTSHSGFVADVFATLPYRSFYIDLLNLDEHMHTENDEPQKERIIGCFIFIDKFDGDDKYAPCWIVYMTFCSENLNLYSMKNTYPCLEKVDVLDGMTNFANEYERADDDYAIPTDTAGFVTNLIAYIASSNADIVKKSASPKVSFRKNSNGSKQRPVITEWNVGCRIGPTIEKTWTNPSEEGSSHSSHNSPRPHVRAAHWHHYWTGPKENKQLSLRWVSQTFVNCTDSENLPVVEHQSKY